MTMLQPYQQATYYALALDPVHVGTGGYRLGKVDMTIVREPGTNLPKIPGTSLSGVARTYTALATKDSAKYPDCAGKGGEGGNKHCGKVNCPVCVTYGFSRGSNNSSFQGMAQFYDARILFFPVYSMIGPVWVTCPSVLKEIDGKGIPWEKDELVNVEFIGTNGGSRGTIQPVPKQLNLGWLLMELSSERPQIKLAEWPSERKFPPDFPTEILTRVVLVSDKLFSHVVNDNLEVRTSVAIDPSTGAAESGALYSYEAIPRATVLWFDVIYNEPSHYRIKNQPIRQTRENIRQNAEAGLKHMEFMGVGGMGTRGMGRLRVLNPKYRDAKPCEPPPDKQPDEPSVTPSSASPQEVDK